MGLNRRSIPNVGLIAGSRRDVDLLNRPGGRGQGVGVFQGVVAMLAAAAVYDRLGGIGIDGVDLDHLRVNLTDRDDIPAQDLHLNAVTSGGSIGRVRTRHLGLLARAGRGGLPIREQAVPGPRRRRGRPQGVPAGREYRTERSEGGTDRPCRRRGGTTLGGPAGQTSPTKADTAEVLLAGQALASELLGDLLFCLASPSPTASTPHLTSPEVELLRRTRLLDHRGIADAAA